MISHEGSHFISQYPDGWRAWCSNGCLVKYNAGNPTPFLGTVICIELANLTQFKSVTIVDTSEVNRRWQGRLEVQGIEFSISIRARFESENAVEINVVVLVVEVSLG